MADELHRHMPSIEKLGEAPAGEATVPDIIMGQAVDPAEIIGKEYTFVEEVPAFNLIIPFILILNVDGSYSITEENPSMVIMTKLCRCNSPFISPRNWRGLLEKIG